MVSKYELGSIIMVPCVVSKVEMTYGMKTPVYTLRTGANRDTEFVSPEVWMDEYGMEPIDDI